MGYKLTINITDDEYKQIKEIYEKDKKNLGVDFTFDEFLDKWISFAIKTQLQFSVLNDKMSNLSGSLFDNLNLSDFKFGDTDMNDLSNFVNNIFNNKSNKDENSSEDTNKSNSNNTNKKMN